jgi:A/G-specific adenine glycosylase
MAVLRESTGPVHVSRLEAAWPDAVQRQRCLAALVADGLAEVHVTDRYQLPVSPST